HTTGARSWNTSGRWPDRRSAHPRCRSQGGFERSEGQDPRAEEQVLEVDVHIVVVGITATRAVEAAGDACGPEMRRVVPRVALGKPDAEVLRLAPGEPVEVAPHHLDDWLGLRHVDGGLCQPAQPALEGRRELDLVPEVRVRGGKRLERPTDVGQNRLAGLAR